MNKQLNFFVINNFDKPICVFGTLRGTSKINTTKKTIIILTMLTFGNKHDYQKKFLKRYTD